jgi:hypothetical protein
MRNRPPTRPVPPRAPSTPAHAPPLQVRVVADGELDVLAFAKLAARILRREVARPRPGRVAEGSTGGPAGRPPSPDGASLRIGTPLEERPR